MTGKLGKTRSDECSCRIGHTCSACKNKTIVKPKIVVEKPRNLQVPITISYYNPSNPSNPKRGETIVNFLPKSVRWRSKKKIYEPPAQKRFTPICRWYRRRRALNQLVKEHEKERAAIQRKKQKDFEEERLNDFIRWEQLKSHKTQYVPPPSPVVPARTHPASKQRVFYIKETSTKPAKRCKASKAVTVKKYNHRQSITNKFVNCCYRICCQFYCYLTCIIFIIFSVICLV